MVNFIKQWFTPKPLKIIAFDGPERTGKSTQIRFLKNYLQSKGKVVKVLHTSLLAGRDVTKFRIPPAVKDIAYLAALYQALLEARKFLKKDPNNIIIFDRFILTQLAFCERYSRSEYLKKINKLFVKMIKHTLKNGYCGFCLIGRWVGKEDKRLNTEFKEQSSMLPKTRLFLNIDIEDAGTGTKQNLHETIKAYLGGWYGI